MKNQMVFQRYEFKYLITRRQQNQLLAAAGERLIPDEYSHSSIRNIYLDTPDFRLIRWSLEKPVYKEKLRLRSYGWAGAEQPVFMELKKKYRAVVYKRRLALPYHQALACLDGVCSLPDTQIGAELAYALHFYPTLKPVVFLSYERDCWCAKDGGLRVTFDEAIRFRQEELALNSDPWGTSLLAPDHVLMELKVADSIPLWMAHILSDQGLFKTSFSKYGAAYQTIMAQGKREVRKYA